MFFAGIMPGRDGGFLLSARQQPVIGVYPFRSDPEKKIMRNQLKTVT